MEIFEIHITSDAKILDLKEYKTIAVDLLKPDFSLLRTEYMTSEVMKFINYDKCLETVLEIADKLENVIRIKIECPYYPHYKEQSLYMESHFKTTEANYPISRNQKKTTFLGTDRTYSQAEYDGFRKKWAGVDLELCLYDNNYQEDADWFDYWH